MLGPAHLEALAHVDPHAPGTLHTDAGEGPGVESLGKVSAKQEARLTEQQEPAKFAATKGPCLDVAGKHVAGKGRAGGVHASEIAGVGTANVGINLVVWRGQVELGIAPESIAGKEHPLWGPVRNGALRV